MNFNILFLPLLKVYRKNLFENYRLIVPPYNFTILWTIMNCSPELLKKDPKKKAEQSFNDQIQVIQIMHLKLQQRSAKSNPHTTQDKWQAKGAYDYCKKPGHWKRTIIDLNYWKINSLKIKAILTNSNLTGFKRGAASRTKGESFPCS